MCFMVYQPLCFCNSPTKVEMPLNQSHSYRRIAMTLFNPLVWVIRDFLLIYIYIYMCVCVCVCVYARLANPHEYVRLANLYEWVQVSLDVSFIWPWTASKAKTLWITKNRSHPLSVSLWERRVCRALEINVPFSPAPNKMSCKSKDSTLFIQGNLFIFLLSDVFVSGNPRRRRTRKKK